MKHIYLKSKLYLLLGTLISGIVLYSCTKDFDKANTDPNSFPGSVVDPSFLLPGVYKASTLDPGMHERMTQLTNDIFAQYAANEGFSTQQGKTNDEWITSYYNDYHSRFVASLNLAIRLGKAKPYATNDLQIARIWRCWVYSRATDIFGDIPYFKAADGTGENAPYDKQELIYKDMLKELKEASAALSTANPKQGPGQDYVYKDNVDKWKKFANSLRLRLAIRVSVVDATLSKQNAEEAIAAGVFTSEDDNCMMLSNDNDFGWGNSYQYTYYYGWGSEGMSRSMENLLTGLGGQPFANPPAGAVVDDPGFAIPAAENPLDPNKNKFKSGIPSKVDPRGPLYFEPSSAASGANATARVIKGPGDTVTVDMSKRWHGTPAGLSSSAAGRTQYAIANQARFGSAFLKGNRPYEIMTYHEVCFLLAEAAQRGWNAGGNAQAWYEKGITASMKWNNIPDATITAYVASTNENTYGTTAKWGFNSGKTFNGQAADDPMGKIITQKYIALFPDGGWEAWADHRRLHLPILIPFAAPDPTAISSSNGGPGNFVKRITWPAIEAINNKIFYNQAVGQQGADIETTPVWWDK
ncbi:MAG: SusD/RagB family nutrient-binding outer rane lipoprotein [Ferruginibacter sp.]|nr:SusD/RagB family nutrient-binding outer rane lipoprotein [Ferruginibacter sp.]